MPTCKTKAIVLSSTNYGESDKIVTFFTSEYGKIKGIAKGARRSKKRFVNTLEPFTYIKLGFFKTKRGLVRIEYCDLIRAFLGVREGIEKIAFGSSYLELLDNLAGEGQKNLKAFVLLLRFFYVLEDAVNFEGTMPLFELRLLSILGYRPLLSGCVVCRRVIEDEGVLSFSPSEGGLICRDCKKNKSSLIPISGDTVRTFKLSLSVGSDKLRDISLSSSGISESKKLIREFITYHLGKRLKSWNFLDEIKN